MKDPPVPVITDQVPDPTVGVFAASAVDVEQIDLSVPALETVGADCRLIVT